MHNLENHGTCVQLLPHYWPETGVRAFWSNLKGCKIIKNPNWEASCAWLCWPDRVLFKLTFIIVCNSIASVVKFC